MPLHRILCCADLHLGRISSGIKIPAEVDATAVGAWHRIVDLAIAEDATVVCIAGDVFDGLLGFNENRSDFTAGLKKLASRGIQVVAVAGNHDYRVLPRFEASDPPANFHLIGKGEAWEVKQISGINFIGWSFAHAHVNLAALQTPDIAGKRGQIGLLHGDTAPGSAYNPIRAEDLAGKADFWILGHIHLPQQVGSNAAYPGSPQAFDFGPGEQGHHGVFWLEFDGVRWIQSQQVPLSTVYFGTENFEVEAESDEDFAVAVAEKQLNRWIAGLIRESSVIQSVQLRAVVNVRGGKFTSGDVLNVESPHAVRAGINHQPKVDLVALTTQTGPVAQIARLLLAAAGSGKVADAEIEDLETVQRLRRQIATEIESMATEWSPHLGSELAEGETQSVIQESPEELANRLLVRSLQKTLSEAMAGGER